MILEWCRSGGYVNCFKAHARLPIDNVRGFGFDAKVTTDQQMLCEFPLDPNSDRPETLVALCDGAAELNL